MKRIILALALTCSVAILGCSKDKKDDEASGGTSAMTTGLSTVNTKLEGAASVINTTTFLLYGDKQIEQRRIGVLAAGLETVWTTAAGVGGLYDGNKVTLKKWFTDEFTPKYVNSSGAKVTFVGRISNAMDVICYLAKLNFPTDATNLPSNGDHTGTITSAIAKDCGNEDAASTSITMTVTTPSDTTLYDKAFSINMGTNCPFHFKVRINSTAINIATAEDQHCDNNRDTASGAVVLYNKTTDVFRFTYISKTFSSASGFEFYRGYYDGSADASYVLGINSGDNGTANDAGLTSHVAYTVVGKPKAGGTVAISAKSKGNSGSSGVADGTFNGCVDSTIGTTTTGATLTCTMTGVDVATPYTNTILTSRAAPTAIADIYNISDTAGVGFTDNTDMF